MNDYKRVSTQSAPTTDPVRDQLATLGMKIRKSVADGYNVSPAPIQRQPLPSHMSQPPSLTNQYSTFESGSNLSEWESKMHTPALQTLQSPVSNKRKMNDQDYVHPPYGSLQLNEDF